MERRVNMSKKLCEKQRKLVPPGSLSYCVETTRCEPERNYNWAFVI